jgi:hypothetical protein
MFHSNPIGCTIFFFLAKFLALHVSDVICVHHQEHNCSVQPWGFFYLWKTEVLVSSGVEVYFMLILCVLVFQNLVWYLCVGLCLKSLFWYCVVLMCGLSVDSLLCCICVLTVLVCLFHRAGTGVGTLWHLMMDANNIRNM